MTESQKQLLNKVADAAEYGDPYFTEESEQNDMVELLRLNMVEGDVTEVELTEFGYDALGQ
jgi:hypothetical protein